MMTPTVFRRFSVWCLALLIGCGSVCAGLVMAQGQDPGGRQLSILITGSQRLTAEERTFTGELADTLRHALAQHAPEATLAVSYAATDDENEAADQALAIQVAPYVPPSHLFSCDEAAACGRVAVAMHFQAHWSPADTLFSAAINPCVRFEYVAPSLDVPAEAPLFSDVALALYAYATDDCATALPILQRINAQPWTWRARGASTPTMAFLQAQCHRAQGDYHAAVDILQAIHDALPDDLKISAYLADSLAQNFEFEAALALDDRNIAVARDQLENTGNPQDERWLAELYLLRGQHRLYLYQWDAALADYNAALALEHAPPRVYYFRGLLYYTQNTRQAAYDDLTRYLELETEPASPLISLAEQYVTELAALLTTPPAE